MYTRSSTSRSCTTLLTLMKWYQQKRRPTREYTPLYAHVTERKQKQAPNSQHRYRHMRTWPEAARMKNNSRHFL